TQRSGPNRSRSPAVARNTPPARPTSSPSTMTLSSRSSSVWSASLTASTSVSSAIAHVPRRADVGVREEQVGIAGGLGLRGGDARAHQFLGALARRLDQLVGEQACLAQHVLVPAETLARTLFLDALHVDVRARVVSGRVRRSAIVHRFDQRR